MKISVGTVAGNNPNLVACALLHKMTSFCNERTLITEYTHHLRRAAKSNVHYSKQGNVIETSNMASHMLSASHKQYDLLVIYSITCQLNCKVIKF